MSKTNDYNHGFVMGPLGIPTRHGWVYVQQRAGYDWSAIWRESNESGSGYAVGSDDMTPAAAAEHEGWTVIDAASDGSVLAKAPGAVVAICECNGPWAVDMPETD